LLGHDRAIVSPVPGTTRDTVEETADVRGIPVVFADTAGLRESADAIEQEGVRRSRASAERADLVLHILDGSEPFREEDERELERLAGKACLRVVNKIDLPRRLELPTSWAAGCVEVCAASGDGMDRLKDAIAGRVWSGSVRAEMTQATINARHADALRRGCEGATRALGALRADQPLEWVALELRMAVQAVGEIVGKTTTEDLLDQIFGQFCIGK
jgi:tRNA modification GTPase